MCCSWLVSFKTWTLWPNDMMKGTLRKSQRHWRTVTSIGPVCLCHAGSSPVFEKCQVTRTNEGYTHILSLCHTGGHSGASWEYQRFLRGQQVWQGGFDWWKWTFPRLRFGFMTRTVRHAARKAIHWMVDLVWPKNVTDMILTLIVKEASVVKTSSQLDYTCFAEMFFCGAKKIWTQRKASLLIDSLGWSFTPMPKALGVELGHR